MNIAILVKGGMVEEIRSDGEIDTITIVDADFVCCKPDEQWNSLPETMIQIFKNNQ